MTTATENIGFEEKFSENLEKTSLENQSMTSLDDNALTLRAIVTTKEAGVIIGKGGKNVAEMRDATGVKAGVSKVVQGLHDRVLTVTGTLEGVSKAYSFIAQTLLDNPITPPTNTSTSKANNATINLLISHNLMGTVIGRQGAKIKLIQDMSGVRMVASKTLLPQSTERIVEVRGSVDAIYKAILEIGRCLIEDKERAYGTILYNPTKASQAANLNGVLYNDHRLSQTSNIIRTGNGSDFSQHVYPTQYNHPPHNNNIPNNNHNNNNHNNNHSNNNNNNNNNNINSPATFERHHQKSSSQSTQPQQQQQQQNFLNNPNIRTQNISIPSDMVGCIIGKAGSKISEIRKLSGSRISIAKVPHDDTGERMFTIQGTPDANERALYLLYGQLEKEKERRLRNVIPDDTITEEQ